MTKKDSEQPATTRSSDPCAVACPVGRAARLLDGRWTTRIVRNLLSGKQRYSALLQGLPGISPKVLAARLRFLEDEGIVLKTTWPEVPPRTEYELTRLGHGLRPVIEAMAVFGTSLDEGGDEDGGGPEAAGESDLP